MSFINLKRRLSDQIKDLRENRERDGLNIAGELTGLIIDRLVNDGISGDNNKFPLYSERPLNPTKFKDGNRAGAADKFRKSDLIKSYKNWRQFNGLPVDRRTHNFTGDMLKSIRPEVLSNSGDILVIEIKARDPENAKKLEQNSERMGISLLKSTSDEKEFVNDANRLRLQKYFQI
jgi:hypothetical protein